MRVLFLVWSFLVRLSMIDTKKWPLMPSY
uniref:Uncharacterized protein n=1 Tax=Anguilla anguilla TaxID=7936 RepID=A0A0E9W765_ANGAN